MPLLAFAQCSLENSMCNALFLATLGMLTSQKLNPDEVKSSVNSLSLGLTDLEDWCVREGADTRVIAICESAVKALPQL